MEWINKISYYQNVRNEVPNKELAKELEATENQEGIREISKYLHDKNKSVSSDCLAVLYTIGYTKPELIQEYAEDFISLLKSKNNRMVWGSMIALSTIAQLKPVQIYKEVDLILKTIREGTLITEVWGINTLVNLCSADTEYKKKLLPVLFDYLEKCRPIDFPTRTEAILPIINNPDENVLFNRIVEIKTPELSSAQLKKLNAVLKKSRK